MKRCTPISAASRTPACVVTLIILASQFGWRLDFAWGQADRITFNEHIRPILSQNCFPCHGFDAKKRKADLRLDVAEGALTERNGFPIKPGDLEHSEVWARIISSDPDVMMPPPATKKQLTEAQKTLIQRWIEQGATYQKHWAFEVPSKTAPPTSASKWARNPIDQFILQRLEKDGLTPQADADKETVIRRVSFALTGLPPTLSEIDAFLNDTSDQAFDAMVDRYLRSPHFGEEMAKHWLDVARYADTHGLHLDNERQMWAYRDWVVRAFNSNIPFDQFTTWQLAGDLLPNSTPDQLTATGFNRCNVTTSEGGSIAKEFDYRYAVERTSTMIQTWMGLTGGCAVCHDHKYDPLSTKEFYSLYAFFYSAADPAMDGNINVTTPFIKLPKPGQQEALDAATAKEREAKERLDKASHEIGYSDPADETVASDGPKTRRLATDILLDDFFLFGASQKNTSRNAPTWDADPPFGAPSGRRVLRQANGYFHENVITPAVKPIVVGERAKFRIWVRPDSIQPPECLAIVVTTSKGNGRFEWGNGEAFDKGAKAISKGKMPAPGQWTQLEFSADEAEIQAGQTINSIAIQQSGGLVWWDLLSVTSEVDPTSDPSSSFQNWWKSQAGKSPGDVPSDLQAVLKEGPPKKDAEVTDVKKDSIRKLREFYVATICRDILPVERRLWEETKSARMIADDAIEGTFVFKELDSPREAFVMLRGQYDKTGEKVERGVPEVFPPLKLETPGKATRLDLARWLLSPDHPLTARVTVNRLWQQLFGTGLVKTSYDFGSQGETPTHPELLDWLAIRYRESGWDTKELVRLMVSSSTFRQSSRVTPELRQKDPENRLFARGPRFRLDAEQIRDNSLFVSGLANLEVGGRGAKTYQPPNIWEPVGYGDSNTRYYLQEHGASLYRRSLYCFLKRTAPPPFMSNFDGPNREQSCSRRERSNTPLQALQLMNDVQHFEAARALAEKVIADGGSNDADKIQFLYRTVLARRASDADLAVVTESLQEQRQQFSMNPDGAEKAIRFGESKPKGVAPAVETAAWTMIANLLLNLDETVTRN